MAKRRTNVDAIIAAAARDPVRGEIFWWLYDNHDRIEAASVGGRLSWKALAANMTELGPRDGVGNTRPKPRTLRQTFGRVCKFTRREAEAREKEAALRNRNRRLRNRPRLVVVSETKPPAR